MEPVLYIVADIDGEYAILRTEQGEENRVAMALLPPDIDRGNKLLWENFQYQRLEKA